MTSFSPCALVRRHTSSSDLRKLQARVILHTLDYSRGFGSFVRLRGEKGTHWHYDFRVRGVRYRGAIPEARTKWEAEKAESKLKQDVFEGRFGKVEAGTMKLKDFVDEIYMPWAKANEKSWLNDHYNQAILKQFFGNKQLRVENRLKKENEASGCQFF